MSPAPPRAQPLPGRHANISGRTRPHTKTALPAPPLPAFGSQVHPPTSPTNPSVASTSLTPPPSASAANGWATRWAPPLTEGHADTLAAVPRAELAALEGAAAAANVRPLAVHLLQQQRQLALEHLQLPLSQQVLAPPQLLRL